MKNSVSVVISSLSPKDTKETRTMHSKSGNKETMIGIETNEIIQEHLIFFYKNIKKA